MYQDGKQLETVSHRSDTYPLLPWLAEWNHFVHECRGGGQGLGGVKQIEAVVGTFILFGSSQSAMISISE